MFSESRVISNDLFIRVIEDLPAEGGVDVAQADYNELVGLPMLGHLRVDLEQNFVTELFDLFRTESE